MPSSTDHINRCGHALEFLNIVKDCKSCFRSTLLHPIWEREIKLAMCSNPQRPPASHPIDHGAASEGRTPDTSLARQQAGLAIREARRPLREDHRNTQIVCALVEGFLGEHHPYPSVQLPSFQKWAEGMGTSKRIKESTWMFTPRTVHQLLDPNLASRHFKTWDVMCRK